MEAILHIGTAQFVFTALLALTRAHRQVSDWILGSWLLLMAIFMSLTLLKNEWPESFWGQLQLFPFFFTLGPFLFLYVRTLTNPKPRLEFADGLHLLPFVIFSVVAVTLQSRVDEDILVGNSFRLNRLAYSVSALVSVAAYVPLTIVLLNQHRRNLLDHFSYTSERISLNWLRFVVFGFTATFALTLLSALVNVGTGQNTVNPGIFLFLGFTAFAFAFTIFGIRQPAIFQRTQDIRFVDHMEAEVLQGTVEEAAHEHPEKYVRSSLTAELAHHYLADLARYMGEEKPFLHRDLTVLDVATHLGIPQHHLTQAMNEHLQKNFYTLVNEYRMEEVKRRLLDPKYGHLTVLAIAHDAGFNSKSSFNMTFKRYVGMTPSQYRAAQTLAR